MNRYIYTSIVVFQIVMLTCQFLLMSILFHAMRQQVGPVTVQGRLREHSKIWLSDLEASEFVEQIVQFGYRISFLALPAPIFHFNHQSALQNEEFVSSAIVELVKGGCVVPCSECPLVHVYNPPLY